MQTRSLVAGAALVAAVGIGALTVNRVGAEPDAAARAVMKPNVVTIHAKDFAYSGPSSIPAGWTTFHLVNDGQALHHLTIVKLNDGKTFGDLMNALKNPGPPPSWIQFVGGPNAANPGGAQTNATVDLAPGNYAILCFVDVPGGVPHFAKGMAHAFTVTAGARSGSPPAADETVTLNDYSFTFSKPLTAGTHTFQVRNAAKQTHELELMQLAPGKTAEDMMKWIQTPNGPPPGSSVGGMANLDPGTSGYFTASLTPGNYMFVCFVPDAKDGKPHFMHGMLQTVAVK